MRKLLVLTVVAITFMGGSVGTNAAEVSKKTRCVGIHQGINFYRNATHKWQTKLGEKWIKSSKFPIRSCQYAGWVAELWQKRAFQARKRYESYVARFARYDRVNANIWDAIEFAAPLFGVSADRLHHRVSKEGGHGDWIPNSQGSDAGGWFQFMPGTFYSYSSSALRKVGIPLKFNSWYSPLGQAVTAAYMFSLGLECTKVGWAASC